MTTTDISTREWAMLAVFDVTITLAFIVQYFWFVTFLLVYSPDYSVKGTMLEQWISLTNPSFIYIIDSIILMAFLMVNFYYLIYPAIDKFVGRYKVILEDTKPEEEG
jgi:uncharacterized RDD family membrane protein YckC